MQREKKGDYHKLIIWQKGKSFIRLVYQKTENFPKSEIFGLQSQLRRAVISFLLNIVEGHRRNFSQKEFLRFLEIADSSLVEAEACLEIALDLEYLSQKDYQEIEEKRKELAVMLNSFMKRVKLNL
ncbi:four helix bundle protein [Candidatus Shapirobacteria bacterium]|nr:four helix bundle protein [Candidatus Shapirobacteria bacterium]